MDITWKKYEKDIHNSDSDIQRKALDAFIDERELQLKTSEKARNWEKGRKEEVAKNKPIWRKEKDDVKKEKSERAFKNLLKAGTFVSDLKPAPGYLLITVQVTQSTSDSGIIIAQTVEEPNEGEVIEIGKQLVSDKVVMDCPCEVGDRILFKRGAGLAMMIKDKPCKLIYFPDVLGIFKQ